MPYTARGWSRSHGLVPYTARGWSPSHGPKPRVWTGFEIQCRHIPLHCPPKCWMSFVGTIAILLFCGYHCHPIVLWGNIAILLFCGYHCHSIVLWVPLPSYCFVGTIAILLFCGYHCHPIVLWVPLPSYCFVGTIAIVLCRRTFSSVAHITRMVNYGNYKYI